MALPTSNVAGNNQTNPGSSGIQPILSTPFLQGSGTSNQNPFFTAPPIGTITPSSGSMPTVPGPGTGAGGGLTLGSSPGGGTGGLPVTPQSPADSTGSLYDTTSHQSSGQTDIDKQLVDIYGKGVGGSLDNLLKGMSGTDSAIFKQFLASMGPMWQQQRTQLAQGLGSAGVSANSSVAGLANANLAAQQSSQASGVNAQLMQTQLQDTMDILMGTKSDAAKEVASSGWDVLANVMSNVTGDIGNLFPGGLPFHPNSNPSNLGVNNSGGSSPNELDQIGAGTFTPDPGIWA